MKRLAITEVGEPTLYRCINQLKELHDKGYINAPQYSEQAVYDEQGHLFAWRVQCCVRGYGMTCAVAPDKKSAKRECSYGMLCEVVELCNDVE